MLTFGFGTSLLIYVNMQFGSSLLNYVKMQ